MAKLFVALDLPEAARAALVRLQPAAVPGIRLTESSQMHLTLHFIGEGEVERYSAALARVSAPAFPQSLEGVGQFPTAGGTTTLWAGVPPSPGLLQLREAAATALGVEGFKPEARPYRPHLTLARCEPGFSPSVIEEFLRTNAEFAMRDVAMESFGLYTSSLVADVPVYRCERTFPLRR